MKKDELLSYIYDFVSILSLKLKNLNEIESIILFGSAVRGDYDDESDIDIFIDVKSNTKKIEEAVNESINQFEIKSKETWHLKGMKNPIKCVVGNINDERWGELRKEILSNNLLLYGRMNYKERELSPYHLFEYSLKKLNQNKRMDFLRKIAGYRSKKKKKTYIHKGLLSEINGIKLENNNILVPIKETSQIQEFFRKNKITPKVKEVWITK